MLQCVAVLGIVKGTSLQEFDADVKVRCRVLQCIAVYCSVLRCVAVCRSALQYVDES